MVFARISDSRGREKRLRVIKGCAQRPQRDDRNSRRVEEGERRREILFPERVQSFSSERRRSRWSGVELSNCNRVKWQEGNSNFSDSARKRQL